MVSLSATFPQAFQSFCSSFASNTSSKDSIAFAKDG
jgi:hypothetical protein